jgi:hypothetical protein
MLFPHQQINYNLDEHLLHNDEKILATTARDEILISKNSLCEGVTLLDYAQYDLKQSIDNAIKTRFKLEKHNFTGDSFKGKL